jgi:Insertion element 4 transposase N-terminal/Transposase DDE domain
VFYRTGLPPATGSAAGSEPSGAGGRLPGRDGLAEPGVPAGMLVTPAPAVAGPSGWPGAGALVCGPPGLASGDQVVLWQPVAAGPAKVRRDGTVLVDAWLPELARLGVLEQALGPGTIEALCARYGLTVRRRRLLSPAFVIRCVLAAAMMPDADWTEVQMRVAGPLAAAPLARRWHPAGPGELARCRRHMPVTVFADLFWRLAGPIDDGSGPGLTWRGLLVCATDGFLTRVPDTKASRQHFGSAGTSDDSAPFPQLQAQIVCVAGNRASLGAAWGPASAGEQTLTWRLVTEHPEIFAPGRVIIFDRCWPGAELVAAIARLGAHVICRLKSGLDFPLEGPCGDGSHATHLDTAAGPLPARLIDYRLDTPRDLVDGGRDPDECYTLLTTLTGPDAYPAAEIAALYPMRWSGAETLIGENKPAITGAGPSLGPMLRSATPHQVDQEMYAWLAACQALRITGHGALQAARAGDPADAAPGGQGGARIAVRARGGVRDVSADPVTARELSFTVIRREALRSIGHGAAATPAHLAPACRIAWQNILARLHPRRPARHRPRVCKWRPAFPAPKTRPVTVTGATAITVFGAPAPADTS